MPLKPALAWAILAALLTAACGNTGGVRGTASGASAGRTPITAGWSMDDLPAGSVGRRLYNDAAGQSRVVDTDVIWARPANECVLYKVVRGGSQVVYAAHAGKIPIVVGVSDFGSFWYPDDRGFRHYQIRQDGLRRMVHEQEINPYDTCVAASKSAPIVDGWAQTSSLDLAVEPERSSFDMDGETRSGVTRLHIAIHGQQPGLIEVLLNAGADVNVAGERGRTPLMAATGYAVDPAILQQLLRAGATVDATDNEGMTALMHAVQAGAIEHARILLSHGANVTLTNAAGQTPLDLAGRSSERMKTLILEATKR